MTMAIKLGKIYYKLILFIINIFILILFYNKYNNIIL